MQNPKKTKINRDKPLTWQGAKTPLLPVLLPLIESIPHRCFVEVFAGSAIVTLAKPPSSKVGEVINDLNGDLVNFYRCMIQHGPEMRRLLRHTINSRQIFTEAKLLRSHRTDIQRACDFLYLNRVSFGGGMRNYGVAKGGAGGGAVVSWPNVLRMLKAASARMHRVNVECLTWQRCLKVYDGPDSLLFIDPPYVGTIQDTYESFTLAKMQELHDAVMVLKGRWIVTTGDTPAMREMWQDCQIQSVSRARGISARNAKPYAELIITAL